MKASELSAILSGLGPGLHAAVEKSALAAAQPLLIRIADLEARIAAVPEGKQGPQGIPGDPGPTVPMAIIEAMVETAVGAAMAKLPTPKDGERGERGDDGKDGESITLQDVQPWISEEIGRQLAQMFDKHIATLPVPKDGRDGRDVDLALVNAAVAECVKREVGAIPKPRDGVDGFTPDDFDATLGEDGRTIKFTLRHGEREITRAVRLGLMQYKGIWREGEFDAGDVVTWAGSAFVAQRETTAKPETDDSWKLCVKRGRDGRDGKNGERGERGLPAPVNGSAVRP